VPSLSIIVPTLHEVHRIPGLAGHLRACAPGAQVIIVDGGSEDGTAEEARREGLEIIERAPGRAHQMNQGVWEATGDHLLFLHADTRLPERAEELVAATLADPSVALGAFAFRFAERGRRLAFVEAGARLRSAIRPTPYGDQCLFLRRETFNQLDGFGDLPAMEDFDLVERARALGSIRVLDEEAVTSARRYLDRGPLRLMLRHWWLSFRFLRGWRPGPQDRVRR